MKLITLQTELEAEFTRLMREYREFRWLTAWAGVGSRPFQHLRTARDKIRRIVVGIHFYQTHPDFIREFIRHKHVRFIKQPQGTFHPKLYLFYDDANSWEMLVGSANFTNEAFTRNTEATGLIAHDDVSASTILKAALATIDESWHAAGTFTRSELEAYRTMWENQKPKAKSLSGQYGGKQPTTKPLYQTVVATRTWQGGA